jgi:hypothetical protein
LNELRALAKLPDSEIDFSDIPEQVQEFSPRGSLPLEEHTVLLRVDSEVAEWLEKAAMQDADRINWLLKREAMRNKQTNAAVRDLLDKAS